MNDQNFKYLSPSKFEVSYHLTLFSPCLLPARTENAEFLFSISTAFYEQFLC